MERCACVPDNTLECNKEDGYCKCKQGFYGSRCENECVGHLHCPLNSNNCLCPTSLEAKIEQLKVNKDHLEQQIEAATKNKNHLIVQLAGVGVVVILMFLALLVYKYKLSSRQLKQDSVRYMNERRTEFNNSLYDGVRTSNANDSTKAILRDSTTESSNLYQKVTDGLLRRELANESNLV